MFAEPRTGGAGFDYVVNLAAETAHGKSDEMYQKMVDGAAKLGAAAAASGTVKKFIHVSTAQVYKCDKGKAAKESGSTSPWTVQAEYMLRSEEAVKVIRRRGRCVLALKNNDKSHWNYLVIDWCTHVLIVTPQSVSGLPWIILRPVTVYGPGDVNGACAAFITMCYLYLLW